MTHAMSDVLAGRLAPDMRPDTMPLDRQVRLAAGGLVLVGTILGLHVHPAFHLLPVLVGLALLWSGMTECCGLGLLLARSAVESGTDHRTRGSM
jgi:hypothetical protein